MIKLQTFSRGNNDKVSMTDSSITINSKKFYFNSLTQDDTKPCFKRTIGGKEVINILLSVPKNRKFMFHSGNLKRFFDVDSNNIIDVSELKTAIDYINETDDAKLKANLKLIRDSYLANHTRDEWNAKGL